jgi:dihydrolipoamide dehydrogenase
MYDVAIIGSGPAGYVAAIRASQLNARVCVIEKALLGGVCLNSGCIPTKGLIHVAGLGSKIREVGQFGIKIGQTEIDFSKAQAFKSGIVSRLSGGIEYLFRKRGINLIKGKAEVVGSDEIRVINGKGGSQERIKTKNILIATGSRPAELPFLKFNGQGIVSSEQILNLSKIPKSLLIIGGGVIGCEFASLFNSLGCKVRVVEMMESLLPGIDEELSRALQGVFRKRGIEVQTKTKIQDPKEIKEELILIAVGRTPAVEGLNLEKVGIGFDKKKGIVVDEYLRTGISSIYAAGDCIGGYLLAHVASYEGVRAVENMFIEPQPLNYTGIPNCIFTEPEIASVGLSEKEAKSKKFQIKISKFPFSALGRAHTMNDTFGFIKLVSDSRTDEILGAAIIGPSATELIAIIGMMIRLKIKVKDACGAIFAHPTMYEAVKEALEGLWQGAIHI